MEHFVVPPPDRARLRTLVQSPLRAALLRHFHDRPGQAFATQALVQAVARIPFDISNCVRELAAHGYVRQLPGASPRDVAAVPEGEGSRLLEEFLASPRTLSWNKKRAARLIQVGRETLSRTIKLYDLSPAAAARGGGERA